MHACMHDRPRRGQLGATPLTCGVVDIIAGALGLLHRTAPAFVSSVHKVKRANQSRGGRGQPQRACLRSPELMNPACMHRSTVRARQHADRGGRTCHITAHDAQHSTCCNQSNQRSFRYLPAMATLLLEVHEVASVQPLVEVPHHACPHTHTLPSTASINPPGRAAPGLRKHRANHCHSKTTRGEP